jgi:radical SAM protein with 4Fe4S-binding SPASM domain
MELDQAPSMVIWETTRACDLACKSCPNGANPYVNPTELTTDEGLRLLDQIREFGMPLLVFSGGDPIKRPDLTSLLRRSVALGLPTHISPSATSLLTRQTILGFKEIGVRRMAIGLDGPNTWSHDSFRGVTGAYDRAIDALEDARVIGLETEVQTTLTRRNMHSLDQIAEIAATVDARAWTLFFPLVTARTPMGDDLIPAEYEDVFEQISRISRWAPFDVKTNEAAHYHRFLADRTRAAGIANAEAWRQSEISDGRGCLFISHTGEIQPSAFLPLSAGNVRRDSLVEVYRNSSLFRILRDYPGREGKCGLCEYTKLCGGSRARAYAASGDYLGEDPGCIYEPVPVAGAARQITRPGLVQ